MNRVWVSTYCVWSSYGSILQAMGLKSALKDLGYESIVLQSDRYIPDLKISFRGNITSKIKGLLKLIVLSKSRQRFERSNAFISKYLDLFKYNSFDDLKAVVDPTDHYLAGSDQIWNPKAIFREFYLDFLPAGYKKVSWLSYACI